MVRMASTFSAARDPQKPLADIHKEAGLGCEDCHGTGAKKPVPKLAICCVISGDRNQS
jgi:hypothetical protein